MFGAYLMLVNGGVCWYCRADQHPRCADGGFANQPRCACKAALHASPPVAVNA